MMLNAIGYRVSHARDFTSRLTARVNCHTRYSHLFTRALMINLFTYD